jgi:CHAT domain-containing protein
MCTCSDGYKQTEKLPDFMQALLKKFSDQGYVAAEAHIHGIFGNFLLGLEIIEGIKWLESSIPLLWKIGHEQDAYFYQANARKWLQNRSQMEMLNSFNASVKLPHQKIKTRLEDEIELLNNAHQYFVEGNYYASEKVLSEKMDSIQIESNKIHFLTLLVNSKSKLQIDNEWLIRMIDANISNYKHAVNSILTAQMFGFKAIVENDLNGESQATAIKIFETIKLYEDEIKQRLHRFTHTALKLINQNKQLDHKTLNDLEKSELLLNSGSWIAGRTTLKGKLYQAYGDVLEQLNRAEEANTNLNIASSYFSKANNLYELAMNQYRIGINWLTKARKFASLTYYEKSRNIFSKAITILYSGNQLEFIAHFQFMITLSFSEPLLHKLLPEENMNIYLKEANQGYFETLSTYEILLTKNSLGESSVILESIISLKANMVQLINSGFQFFRVTKQLNKALYWLERTRLKALVSFIASNIIPNEEITNHVLIKKEIKLLKELKRNNSFKSQMRLKYSIDNLYQQMLKKSPTADYAKNKITQIPEWEELIAIIKSTELVLGGRNLFFLYFYVHANAIYTLGIRSDLSEPLLEKTAVSVLKLQEELVTFGMKLATYQYIPFNATYWLKFSMLIEPLKKWTKKGDIIGIIPHTMLHNLPLHVLHLQGSPLIKRNPVFYTNSLTSWKYLQTKARRNDTQKNFYVFGDPEENLPKSRKEAKEINHLLKAHEFIGKNASKINFEKILKKASIVHFAGHGFFEPVKGFNSGLRFHNAELLTAHEIINQKTRAELIVLASCNTALQKNHEGDELSGLNIAFLAAGSNAVLSGLWTVDDDDSQQFFSEFYQELAKNTWKVIAIQKAMITLMQRPNKSHFYHWGMYTLTGSFW